MDAIETQRLVLRAWQDDDAPRLFDIHSRPDVRKWLSDDFDHPHLMPDLDYARERIAGYAEVFEHPPQGVWAIERGDTGEVAGGVLLKTLPNAEHDEIEIGWWLHPDSLGRGYATEAATAVMEHAFTGGLDEVWAVMWPANAPSQAVMRRLGMTDEGLHERWYPGVSRVFRLTAQEWSQGRP